MTVFADLGDLSEEERILNIARAITQGNTVAVIVDNEVIAERYLKKLRIICKYRIISQGNGPVPHTFRLSLGPELQ